MNAEYHVAIFTGDGSLHGTTAWGAEDLSSRWMNVCTTILDGKAQSFRAALPPPMEHLEVKLTSAPGVGLATFHAHGHIALSALYLAGTSPEREQEVRDMFVASLRRTVPGSAAAVPHAFEEIGTFAQRPLHVVVMWGNPDVADTDYELLRDFSTHFAAAFMHVGLGDA